MSSSHASTVVLPWPRVRLIIALYLPEFKRVLTSLESAGGEFDEALQGAESGAMPGLKLTLYDDLAEASEHFDEAIEQARVRITDETRAISSAREASTAPPDALRR